MVSFGWCGFDTRLRRYSTSGVGLGSDQVLREAALDEAAVSLRSEVLVAVDDDLAAREHGVDVTVDFEALPGRVVHVHVVGLALAIADARVAVGVVDDDVGVRPGLDHALLAIEA